MTPWRSRPRRWEFTASAQTTVRSVDERLLSDCGDGVTALSAVVLLLLHLQVSSLSQQEEVRALVEGQFLSRRLHAERLGYSIRKSSSPCFLSSVVFSYRPGSGRCSSGPIGDGQAGHVVCGQRASVVSPAVCLQLKEVECWRRAELHPTERSCRSVWSCDLSHH